MPGGRSRRAIILLAGALGLAIACVAGPESSVEPCESGANNYLDNDGVCVCRPTYEWCDPNDPENLNCCEAGDATTGGGGLMPCESGTNNKLDDNGDCVCRLGYEWCDPNDPNDLNCCEPSAETSAETGTSG